MSRNEKGYFKKYSKGFSSDNDNRYIRLFDLLNKQKKYDENAIINELEKEGKAKHFSALKNYLFNLILGSLRVFHSEKNKVAQINACIEEAEILFSKGFFNLSKTLLRKAKTLSYEIEYLSGILISINAELALYTNTKQIASEELQELLNERQSITDKIIAFNFYSSTYTNLFARFRKFGSTNKSFIAEVSQMSKQLQKPPFKTLDFNSIQNSILIKTLMCNVLDKPQEFKQSIQEMIQLFEQHPKALKAEKWQISFFRALSNGANVKIKERAYGEAEKLLDNMEQLSIKGLDSSVSLEANVFEAIYSFRTLLYLYSGRFPEGIALIKNERKNIFKFQDYLSSFKQTRLHHINASLLIAVGRYNDAIDILQKAFTEKSDLSNQVHIMSKCLEILCHIELGNHILVESLVMSIMRAVKKREQGIRSIKLTLSLFKTTAKQLEDKKLKVYYQKTKEELSSLLSSDIEKDFIDNVFIIPFINSSLHKTSLEKEIALYFK